MKMVHAAIKVFESVKAAIVLEWPFLFVSLQRGKSKEEEKKASQFRCEAVCWCCCWPVANGPPETLLPPKSRSETKTKSPRTFCFKIWYYWACWAQLMEMGVWEVFLLLSFEPSDCSQAFWLDTLWQNYIFDPKSWLWLKKAAAVCLQLKLFTMSPISCLLTIQLFVYNFEWVFLQFQLFVCNFSCLFTISAVLDRKEKKTHHDVLEFLEKLHFVTVCYYWHYQHRHAHLFKLLYQCQKRSKERSVLLEDYYYNHFLRKKRKAK